MAKIVKKSSGDQKFAIDIVNRRAGRILSRLTIQSDCQNVIAQLTVKASKSNRQPLLRLSGLRQLEAVRSLTLVFVGEKEGRELNKRFRKKGYATDVLSFAPVEEKSLGELVFCWPVLKRQAMEHDLSLRDEFRYLLIHGILHLLGYDHENHDRQAKEMYRLQDNVFDILTSR